MGFAIEYLGHRCPTDSAIKPWTAGYGPVPGDRLVLGSGRLTLGRGLLADLRTRSNGIARQHLSLQVVGEQVELQDLGGTNGTLLDGAPISQANATGGEIVTVAHFFDFKIIHVSA